MPVVAVRIPQLGEGLQEALLVEFLKQPGDVIKRDEPIYVMETDKATTEVESPYDGTLVEWVVSEGQVLGIGTMIANMEVAEGTKEMAAGHEPASHSTASQAKEAAPGKASSAGSNYSSHSSTAVASAVDVSPVDTPSGDPNDLRWGHNRVAIPPRTRRYLKDKGLQSVAFQIPAAGSKLMPHDVDRFLESGGAAASSMPPASTNGDSRPQPASQPQSTDEYDEAELPRKQQTLNYRLTRGSQLCIPVNVMVDVDWTKLNEARQIAKKSSGPTAFAMMLWCVTRAAARHSKFRSSISNDGRILRTYHHANLGIAVALPGDELLTAVVHNADQMPPAKFYSAVEAQIDKARNGEDQADASTTISVSNIGTAGMKVGIPAIVAPAVATLAVGHVFDQPFRDDNGEIDFRKTATLSLTFDHRVINGIGGADFLSDVKKEIESFEYPF